MRMRVLPVVAAMVVLLTGCGSAASESVQGDCNVKVRYDDAVYRAVTVQLTPRPGRSLGEAEFGNCDGSPLDGAYRGKLFALPGTDTRDAVLLRSDGHDSVYVSESLPARKWPSLVQAATGFPACQRPARFTGTWDTVDPRDIPNTEDIDSVPVPLRVSFTATRGTGLKLDRWSSVSFLARITGDTQPVPSERFLQQAVIYGEPVVVSTTCRGDRFEVRTIRFAE